MKEEGNGSKETWKAKNIVYAVILFLGGFWGGVVFTGYGVDQELFKAKAKVFSEARTACDQDLLELHTACNAWWTRQLNEFQNEVERRCQCQ
jgi:hypothetical protein